MAVPGRRRSVPTDLNNGARDAPLPWGSGLGTLRVLSRKPRLNPPGFESPGLLTCVCACGRMGSAGRSASARLRTPVLAHTWMWTSLDVRCASRLRILSATFTSSFTSKTKQLNAEISKELSPRVRASLTCGRDAGPEVGPAHQAKR